MSKYRWNHPQEWLAHRVAELTEAGDVAALVEMLTEAVSKLDADEIQDLWQADMDADGYFHEEVV